MATFVRLEPEPDKADYLPYAPAVVVPAGSEYFFLSGVSALPLYHAHPHVPEETELPDDAVEQTRRMMANLAEQLEWLGLDWSNVVHIYEFLTDMRDTDDVHRTMYRSLVERADADESWTPASTLIGVNSLSSTGARVEFDIIAARPPSGPVAARPRPPRIRTAGRGTIASVASDEELLWMSGSTAIDFYHHHPHIEDEEDVPYRASGQVEKIFRMFDPVLAFMSVGWGDVVKFSVWATDSRDLEAFERTIDAEFAGLPSHPPTVTVDIDALSGPAARLELEMVATRGPRPDASAPASEPAPVIEALHPDPQRAHLLPFAPVVHVADAPLHFLPGVGPVSDGPLPDDVLAQLSLLMDDLDAQLAALGLGWRNVVKLIQFVTDIREADAIGTAFAVRYGTSWTPAATLTHVDALPVRGARVQLDVIVAG